MIRLLLFLLLSMAMTTASSADFLDDPKALCSYFESLGMKAQMRWGPAAQGDTYFCQYADEFSSTSRHVRAAQAYVNPKDASVGLGLSIQSLGGSLVRAEAADELQAFVESFYRAQKRAIPDGLNGVLQSREPASLRDEGLEFSNADGKLWDSHYVVGANWKRKAAPALLASLKSSVGPLEKARAASAQQRLEARCDAAVAATEQVATAGKLQRKTTPLSASRFLVEFNGAAGSFICQVCDDEDPTINCGTMGLMLNYRGKDGTAISLPAELGRKCAFYLQKEMMSDDSGVFIDHEIVKRISTREVRNDKRYIFEHELDGEAYRCVIRKIDLNFSLERKAGDGDWRAIAAGILI